MFTTHGVGQGLFYSGRVEAEGNTRILTFVYDCGVVDDEPKRLFLQQRIDEFQKSTVGEGQEITALFVSHLHEDHVSGLESLLKILTPRYVFLPYLSEIDRLTAAAANPDAQDWYFSFLMDPVAYLIERKAGKVVLLRRYRGEGPTGIDRDQGRDRPRETDEDAVQELDDDDEFVGKIRRGETEASWARHLQSGRLLIKTDKRALNLPLWRFRFRSIEPDWAALSDFHHEALKLLASRTLRDLLKDPAQRTKLRKLYNALTKRSPSLHDDLNNTSLVTFHGPYSLTEGRQHWQVDGSGSCVFFEQPSAPHPSQPEGKPFGTLLTGDVNLRLSDTYSDVLKHFTAERGEIRSVQVPHHGSRWSWTKSVIADLPAAALFCVSAGVDSRFRHPSVNVVSDIIDSKKVLLWSNQFVEVVHMLSLTT